MIFGANELPTTRDTKNAFWERWILLEFPYTFISKNIYDTLPESEKKMVKIKDENIIEKITSQDEMSGLFNWALEGLHRLLEKKDIRRIIERIKQLTEFMSLISENRRK
jgi:putative DNA primase/helicase